MEINANLSFVAADGQVYYAYDLEEWPFQGKTIYEVIRIMEGKPLFMEEHLERLKQSGLSLGMPAEGIETAVAEDMKQVVAHCDIKDNNLKIVAGYLESGAFSYVVFPVKSFYPPESYYENGVKTVLMQVERENPNAKVINAELSAKVDRMRETSEIFEGLLVDSEGRVTEGSRSNVFFVKGDRLLTPKSSHVLLGITRQKLLLVIQDLKVDFEEAEIKADELQNYDACFITGTSIGLLPVARIDEVIIASSSNPLLKSLQEGYDKIVKTSLEKIDWE
ncbi:aminotransferase class IV [Acidaminobacter hydrogenoformans]|uniref:aminotransferase class IV n=1 Tax=Acidaminobacter hydrogenoformans TaxID=65403 RepID=UPI00147E73D2|nr:aminotransferase class IV [Acidaminobacter hydrogenoformans]